jgi:hypothetical protein
MVSLAEPGEAKLEEYCWPDTLRAFPAQYTPKPGAVKTEATKDRLRKEAEDE